MSATASSGGRSRGAPPPGMALGTFPDGMAVPPVSRTPGRGRTSRMGLSTGDGTPGNSIKHRANPCPGRMTIGTGIPRRVSLLKCLSSTNSIRCSNSNAGSVEHTPVMPFTYNDDDEVLSATATPKNVLLLKPSAQIYDSNTKYQPTKYTQKKAHVRTLRHDNSTTTMMATITSKLSNSKICESSASSSSIGLLGPWSKPPYLVLLLSACSLLLLGLPGEVGSQENTSHPYGEIGYGYWAEGATAYPCTSPEECALMYNNTDPLRDAILLEEEQEEEEVEPCVIAGHLAKSVNWYGYLAEFLLKSTGGRIYYRFVYPEDRCCIKIIFYLEEQVLGLRARMNCLQKQAMVDPSSRQVIILSPSDPSSGCISNKTDNGVRVIECTSGRVLKSNEDRKWYIAASSCGSPTGLDIRYSFVAYGHRGKCPVAQEEVSAANSVFRASAYFDRASGYFYFLGSGTCRFLLISSFSFLMMSCHLLLGTIR